MALPKDHDPDVVGVCSECGMVQRAKRMYSWNGDGTPPCSTCGAPTFVSRRNKIALALKKYKDERGVPG
jgi:uncharacterized paraquat-inducible protein A